MPATGLMAAGGVADDLLSGVRRVRIRLTVGRGDWDQLGPTGADWSPRCDHTDAHQTLISTADHCHSVTVLWSRSGRGMEWVVWGRPGVNKKAEAGSRIHEIVVLWRQTGLLVLTRRLITQLCRFTNIYCGHMGYSLQ